MKSGLHSGDFAAPARLTAEELIEHNVETILELDAATRARRTRAQRLADKVASFCGSVAFLWTHSLWFGVWVIVNTLPALKPLRFDPFPYFFLTFIVAVEAIFLVSFILISQKREGAMAERRNHLLLQVSLLNEQENTKSLQMLQQILAILKAEPHEDAEMSALSDATDPERIVRQIEEVSERVEAAEAAQTEALKSS